MPSNTTVPPSASRNPQTPVTASHDLPAIGYTDRCLAKAIDDIPIWVGEFTPIKTPRIFETPSGPQPIGAESSARIISSHLERIFTNRTRYNNVIYGPGCAVTEQIVCAAGRDGAFKNPSDAYRVVIINLSLAVEARGQCTIKK